MEVIIFNYLFKISVNMVSLITDIEAHRKTPRFERGLNEY